VSGAGCGPTPGCGPRHPEVSLDTVADACLRAVREDPAEVLVAPALRVAVLAPELMQPVLRSSVVPPEVLDRQRSKR